MFKQNLNELSGIQILKDNKNDINVNLWDLDDSSFFF